MLNLQLFYTDTDVLAAIRWQALLQNLGVMVQSVLLSDTPQQKFFKQQSEQALLCDADGLWLIGAGMRMQPDWIAQVPRLRRANHKNELLARACQLDKAPRVLDATAGLGHDSLLMAWLGAKVTMIERHPVLYALLLSAHEQTILYAQRNGYNRLLTVLAQMTICYGGAENWLANVDANHHRYDVIYLDPMFSRGDKIAQKQPQIKKEMQILHLLLANDNDLGECLLAPARLLAPRVIVKRAKLAPALANITADHCWLGDACRFDAYFTLSLDAHSPQIQNESS